MKFAITGITTLAVLCGVGQVSAADGKAVYKESCAGCHEDKGMPEALKLSDKAAWAPLLKKGSKALVDTVIKGSFPMPPRGGAKNDADAKAAVEYIIDSVK
jgi:cytochrome c5